MGYSVGIGSISVILDPLFGLLWYCGIEWIFWEDPFLSKLREKNRCTWNEFVKWLSVKLLWTEIKVFFWATFVRLSRHWRRRRPQFHERLRWRPSPFAGVAIQQFLEIPMPSNHPPSYLQRNTHGKPQFFHQDVFKICFADCILIYLYTVFQKKRVCVCVWYNL